MNRLDVTTSDKQYRVIMDADGKLTAERHGKPWRECVGDNLIYMLASDLADAREGSAEKELCEVYFELFPHFAWGGFRSALATIRTHILDLRKTVEANDTGHNDSCGNPGTGHTGSVTVPLHWIEGMPPQSDEPIIVGCIVEDQKMLAVVDHDTRATAIRALAVTKDAGARIFHLIPPELPHVVGECPQCKS